MHEKLLLNLFNLAWRVVTIFFLGTFSLKRLTTFLVKWNVFRNERVVLERQIRDHCMRNVQETPDAVLRTCIQAKETLLRSPLERAMAETSLCGETNCMETFQQMVDISQSLAENPLKKTFLIVAFTVFLVVLTNLARFVKRSIQDEEGGEGFRQQMRWINPTSRPRASSWRHEDDFGSSMLLEAPRGRSPSPAPVRISRLRELPD